MKDFKVVSTRLIQIIDSFLNKIPPTRRRWISFWILGLSNNYTHLFVLLSAYQFTGCGIFQRENSDGKARAILLSDIVPCLLVKSIAPFAWNHPIHVQARVIISTVTALLSLLVMCFTRSVGVTSLGVMLSSISSSLGEVTFLSFSTQVGHLDTSSWVAAFSSGTGVGELSAIVLFLLFTSGMSLRVTLVIMFLAPAIMVIAFWFILPMENHQRSLEEYSDKDSKSASSIPSGREIVRQVWRLFFPYVLPLGFVYFFDSFIRGGLLDFLIFPELHVKLSHQRVMMEVFSLLGTGLGRTSVVFINVPKMWILPIIQGVLALLLIIHIMSGFLSFLSIVNFFLFFQGILAGAAYGNTFLGISQSAQEEYRWFDMSITPLSGSIGVILAALVVRR